MASEPWKWRPPPGWTSSSTGLRLYSSYHNAVVLFVPRRGSDSLDVDWYACGPTVYEASILQHHQRQWAMRCKLHADVELSTGCHMLLLFGVQGNSFT